ncbi:tRNA (adenosine(37)-N6)-dimethylallyltransferase MiaA [Ruegeria sp. HKCCD6228]|uniref:tRNA dimethylallyltransferase n=1 Tax=Ruegeria atlantica TaxID=81569 RepID=A0ABX1W917_9RHOB|nr:MULTISPECIES: tRNA (adenosine(37)-N6)-dimethylallyltransferase MiaA [Ruegeria]NOD29768.1 tRNA (adenosine(37)-N6)-dimethylallyltransferase MiaA [Ruegeria atlantica]NOD96361.1 tRNA (adenosine(37)-N6)-dimethylallyltransferase MiaA [Ruegeria sp. HKCCD6228]
MTRRSTDLLFRQLPPVPDDKPVLIAGPTASGKSALALEIAERHGGVIVNADASQVYDCWRVISARPSAQEEARAPHLLYGHVAYDQDYSTGHWLREVLPLLTGHQRPIIVGGTGLYFSALTEGMAQIPATPPEVRAEADQMPMADLLEGVDADTLAKLDIHNRARVQRAWEVQRATGRSLLSWQAETPPPALRLNETLPIVFDVDKAWLLNRIERRFDQMLEQGAIEEVRAMQDRFDPTLPACKAIGVPELRAYLDGAMTLYQAREHATIATRQFAKRQRTWFRARMKAWNHVDPSC